MAPEQRTLDVGDTLVIDVDGFEGPLDLLLALARTQKVDLARISILQLVDQYLAFVERVRQRRLELAADLLVMAAWLAYLKSRLLLPSPAADDEPSGEELAAALAFRLRRLGAMREVAAKLVARTRLGRDVFPRGAAESAVLSSHAEWRADLGDLLGAYAGLRQKQIVTSVRVVARSVWTLSDARDILERIVGETAGWVPIHALVADWAPPDQRATAIASTFSASLELVHEGRIELTQSEAFAPLWARARTDGRPDPDPETPSEPQGTPPP
ncbi:segregation/condensation protein A [Siculibacillus lacustris]|uniref:Segregation and condensation protein A n=1 Tax=Siculibacillus lacustris TaxID=1549641 RepID=A0A4Q9VQH4_9HYPH|nr:ScpA family protein [Siculibacillus lacustris]TBW38059.1 segregation/condensation protein A [Siculibacillus lacustris]